MDTTSVLGTLNNLYMPGLGSSRQLVAELEQSTLKNSQLCSSEIDMHESYEASNRKHPKTEIFEHKALKEPKEYLQHS